jgi:hypothetical protein
MNDNLTTNASNEAKIPAFLVCAVIGQLPTNEEIDLIIEQDLPFSEEYQKYSEKEKTLILAATKAGAKWFRSSLIEGNFR